MDDRRRRTAFCLLAVSLLAVSQTGCALLVMAGKMFYGDPVMPSVFEEHTEVDLSETDKKVLVVCTTGQAVKSEFPTLDLDVTSGVSHRLRYNGINVVDRDQLSTWIDDNGGVWGTPNEIAAHCDADFLVVIDLEQYSYRNRNSPGLFRGNAVGSMHAYEIVTLDERRVATELFEENFQSTYPEHTPVAQDQMSDRVFQQKYLERVVTRLGQMLHSYRFSDMIE